MKRQLDDYMNKYYLPLFNRAELLKADDFNEVRKLASWKFKILRNWDSLEVIEIAIPDSTTSPLDLGDVLHTRVVISLADLSPNDLRVELVSGHRVNDEMISPTLIHELTLEKQNGNLATYASDITTTSSGVFDIAFRITPKHDMLPHRLDFNLVKWV
jgi:phosphorylase/glycogen(starch) synthase